MNKTKQLINLIMVTIVVMTMLTGCSNNNVPVQQIVAAVQRGTLEIKADVDGYIETPAAVNLYFDTTMFGVPYSARIKKIYVEQGDMVRAGTVLAKLDDTAQKLNVEAAQYALELALNNVVQTVCCGVNRSPGFYCEAVAFKRFEFAQEEMRKAQVFLLDGKYEQSSEQITLAKLDIEGARDFYSDPDYRNYRPDITDTNQNSANEYFIDEAIVRLNAEISQILELQEQLKEGQYSTARETLQYLLIEMSDTNSVIKRLNHFPGAPAYPDSCTTYTVLSELTAELDKLEALTKQREFDQIRYAEALSLARHDLELGKKIIEENISTFRSGLNMKALRDYNINIQTAIINLERAKQGLLKTELIAPFDGRVEDINLRAGDMIVQRYATTGAPIDSYVMRLADTSYVKMVGIVGEIDAVGVRAGQKARVFIDAAPGKQFNGTVKFISNYGPLQASGIQYYGTIQPTAPTYKVEIELDREQAAGLYGGLTAQAEILVDDRADVLLIPSGALVGKSGEYYVRVLKDQKTNTIEQRPVKIGVQSRTQTEIVSGLKEGELVLLDKVATPARPLNINNINK